MDSTYTAEQAAELLDRVFSNGTDSIFAGLMADAQERGYTGGTDANSRYDRRDVCDHYDMLIEHVADDESAVSSLGSMFAGILTRAGF